MSSKFGVFDWKNFKMKMLCNKYMIFFEDMLFKVTFDFEKKNKS